MTPTDPEKRAGPGTWLAACNLRDGREGLSLLRAEPEDAATRAELHGIQVIFDGVLHNRKDLLGALELGPEVSNALLVATAFQRWGEDLLLKIKGIFALVLWDPERRSLLCARDPMGIYPLYYSETGRELVLSTSVDAIIAHPGVSRALNRAALADNLLHRWPDGSETFYEKVRRVCPGHRFRVDPSGGRTARYWDPIPPGQPVKWIREEELGQFDEVFAEAVRRCLSLGPAAVLLSGGLDSVSVAAAATDESRKMGLPPPWALSLAFPDPECNEETVQRGVANSLGMPMELLSWNAAVDGGWVRAAVEMSSGWYAPLLNAWNPAYYRLASSGPRRGCAVVLTGMGGDEWLGVTPYLAADLIRCLDLRGLWSLYRAQRRSFRASRRRLVRNLVWRYGLRPLLRDVVLGSPGGRFARRWASRRTRKGALDIPAWIAPDPVLRQELVDRGAPVEASNRNPSYYLADIRSAFDHSLVSWEMEEYFENGRRLGAWILHPYQDPDLIECLCRIPPLSLNRGGRTKGLVREYLTRRFPALGFERQKKVEATGYFRSTVLKEGPVAWRGMGGLRSLAGLGVVDSRLTEGMLERIPSKTPSEAYRIWDMLNMEAWVRPRS